MDQIDLSAPRPAEAPQLREYQVIGVQRLRDGVRAGHKRQVLQAPTGSGKTICAAEIINGVVRKGRTAMFIAHRRELIFQTSEKLREADVPHGIIMAGEAPLESRPVQVASKDTLLARAVRGDRMELPPADVIIIDECFPAGTKVDGCNIEDISVGDMVRCFDHAREAVVYRRVLRVFRSRPNTLVTVHRSSGQHLTCTAGHPFFIPGRGYVPAIALRRGDPLLTCEDIEDGAKRRGEVQLLWRDGCLQREKAELSGFAYGKGGVGILLREMQGCWEVTGVQEERRVPESVESGTWLRADEEEQPDAQACSQGACVEDFEEDRAPAAPPRWQREADSASAEETSGCSGVGVGAHCLHENAERGRLAISLQDRHCSPGKQGGNRGGRRESLLAREETSGRAQGSLSQQSWVDRVEVHEQGSDGRYGGRCSDGLVYNIEVEEHHNYFADGVLVHNCHRCLAQGYLDIIDAYPSAVIIGLTATPCRADQKGLGAVYDDMVRLPEIPSLIHLGFLVPLRFYAPSQPDLEGLRLNQHGDYFEVDLEGVMDRPKLVGDVVSNWTRIAPERQTVVFASGVQHSIHLRDEFREAGVVAEHVDGTTPTDERDHILRRVRAGDVQVICNCMVLTEGTDIPQLDACVLARPTRHIGLFLQMVGRVMRPAEGKSDAIVIDHAGAVIEHGFPDEPIDWTLDPDTIPAAKLQEERRKKDAKPITCPECYCTYVGKPECPECGHRYQPKGKHETYIDADLGEVQRETRQAPKVEASREEKERWYRMALGWAELKGYKPGWAFHKYRDKFGVAPANGFSKVPLEPDAAFRRWMKHLAIKYAKSRRAAA